MSWYAHRFWVFAWAPKTSGWLGQITVWTGTGREVWCFLFGKLWVRSSFVKVRPP